MLIYTVCPTRYRTRHFFNNHNTNEDIATKFEQGYVRCVRNEEECVCSPLQISLHYLPSGKIIKEMSISVAIGTHCICCFVDGNIHIFSTTQRDGPYQKKKWRI